MVPFDVLNIIFYQIFFLENVMLWKKIQHHLYLQIYSSRAFLRHIFVEHLLQQFSLFCLDIILRNKNQII